MPTAKITVPSTFGARETYAKIKKLFETSSEIGKLDPDLAVEFDDARLRGVARGRRFRAELKIKDANPLAAVRVAIELPLLLTPFMGQIKREVEKKLVAALGTPAGNRKP